MYKRKIEIQTCKENSKKGQVTKVVDWQIFINCRNARTKEDLMDEFLKSAVFPPYFGRNWDALIDVLPEVMWKSTEGKLYTIVFDKAESLLCEAPPEEIQRLEIVLQAIGEEMQDESEGESLMVIFRFSAGITGPASLMLGA